MKKTFALSVLTLCLFGCGSSSSSGGDSGVQGGVAVPPADPDSRTELTSYSRLGYAAEGLDPADVVNLPIPANAGEGATWVEQPEFTDHFNYTFDATSNRSDFGERNQWYNFYHHEWDGPGATYWREDHVSVADGKLTLVNSRNPEDPKQGRELGGVFAGCIASNGSVQYPVFVEASVSLANLSLASAVWLLTPDDTQEIDILEAYAGADNGNTYFSKFLHLSHHSFIRDPFTDYQPRDFNSWWEDSSKVGDTGAFSSWGEHNWNGGDRQYIQVGAYWVNPYHFEYYVDGELVRVLYNKAFATKRNGVWTYSYPTVDENNDIHNDEWGYQAVAIHATSDAGDEFDFAQLKGASEASNVSVIDPYDYQNGQGFNKAADIIINMELQSWWTNDPTDADLEDPNKNTMLVDWIRTYKPVAG